jgi:hypothetical protein
MRYYFEVPMTGDAQTIAATATVKMAANVAYQMRAAPGSPVVVRGSDTAGANAKCHPV